MPANHSNLLCSAKGRILIWVTLFLIYEFDAFGQWPCQ